MRFILLQHLFYFNAIKTIPECISTFNFSGGNVTFPFDIWYNKVYFWFELTILVLVLRAMVLALVLVLPLLVLTTSLFKSSMSFPDKHPNI